MRDFDAAIHWYRVALSINPRAASTYSALGFSHHLRGDVDVAIELYHQVLTWPWIVPRPQRRCHLSRRGRLACRPRAPRRIIWANDLGEYSRRMISAGGLGAGALAQAGRHVHLGDALGGAQGRTRAGLHRSVPEP